MKTLSTTQTATYTGPMEPGGAHDTDPREFFRVLWRRKWVILLLPRAHPAGGVRLQRPPDQGVRGERDRAGRRPPPRTPGSVAVPDLPSGTANTAKIAALVGTSGVADETSRLMGEPEGSVRGADQGDVTTRTPASSRSPRPLGSGERAARNSQHGREALRNTRTGRGRQACRRIYRERREGPREAPARRRLQRSQLSEKLQGLRALRAAQAENTQVVEPARAPAAAASRRTRSATRSLRSSSRC